MSTNTSPSTRSSWTTATRRTRCRARCASTSRASRCLSTAAFKGATRRDAVARRAARAGVGAGAHGALEEEEFLEFVALVDVEASGSLDFGQFMALMKEVDAARGCDKAGVRWREARPPAPLVLRVLCPTATPGPGGAAARCRANRLADRERELREQLDYDEQGAVTLLVDMLRSGIEMAKENALATLLEFALHDKCADLLMRARSSRSCCSSATRGTRWRSWRRRCSTRSEPA